MTEDELDSLATRWHADAYAPQTLKRHISAAPRRIIRWVPAAALVASGLVAIGVISLSSKPLPAFAEVEKNFKAVQTAQWEEETEEFDKRGRREISFTNEMSLRRSPAALLIAYKVGSRKGIKMPTNKNGIFQNLITPEENRTFDPILNELTVTKHGKEKQARTAQYINADFNYSLMTPDKQVGGSKLPWRTKLVNGELLYERNRVEERYGLKIQERFWVYPKTLQVLRSEVIQDTLKVPSLRSIKRCRNIRYNPSLPESHFRVVTNPGTRVVEKLEE